MAHGLDIFLSYKNEQHSWVARLGDDLKRFGYEVYIDHDTAAGLRAGAGWELQLASKIRLADHFLVLWSELIDNRSYVLKEIDIRRQAGRAVTVVRLDDSPIPPYLDTAQHHFREFVDLYTATANAADSEFFKWNGAVRHLVEQVLTPDETTEIVEIPVVVVAMTHDQARDIKSGRRIVGTVKDDAFARLMTLLKETAPFDPQRYGARPEDWRPFEPQLDPTDSTVEQVIYDFDRAQRGWHREHHDDTAEPYAPHVFVPYSEALRSASTRQKARERLQASPALVVFDPISLVHEAVHGEVVSNGLHTLSKAFVIGVGPRISSSLPPVRTYFSDVEGALFNGLYMTDPLDRSRSLFRPTLSTCVLNVAHGFELSRWLQVASESILSWVGRSRSRMQPGYAGLLRPGPATLPPMVGPR
ncbi:MAG TPA: TIR domain-containing protein [Propionibacteriaceae bacterium]